MYRDMSSLDGTPSNLTDIFRVLHVNAGTDWIVSMKQAIIRSR